MSDERGLPPYVSKHPDTGIYRYFRRPPKGVKGAAFVRTFSTKDKRIVMQNYAREHAEAEAYFARLISGRRLTDDELLDMTANNHTFEALRTLKIGQLNERSDWDLFIDQCGTTQQRALAGPDQDRLVIILRAIYAATETINLEVARERYDERREHYVRQFETEPEPAPIGGPKLPVVFQKWAAARQPTTNTVNETQRAMNQFIALNGDLVMPAYTVAHARAWRDLIAAAESAHGTKIKRYASITNLFRYAWRNEHIEVNPFERVTLERPKRARAAKRRPWTLDQLRTWFNSPIFTERYRPKHGEIAYWAVPLSLFHGMCLGEMCQLDRTDLVERDGIWCLRVEQSEEDGVIDKSVKTEDRIRTVPLHRRLIELGFVEYKDTLSGTKLFPGVRPDSRNRWSGRISNWFGEYRRKLGMSERWVDFHSLRHTFKTAARGVKMDENVSAAISGHEPGTVGARYGEYPEAQLKEAVDLVDFDVVIPRWK
jgi:integrase